MAPGGQGAGCIEQMMGGLPIEFSGQTDAAGNQVHAHGQLTGGTMPHGDGTGRRADRHQQAPGQRAQAMRRQTATDRTGTRTGEQPRLWCLNPERKIRDQRAPDNAGRAASTRGFVVPSTPLRTAEAGATPSRLRLSRICVRRRRHSRSAGSLTEDGSVRYRRPNLPICTLSPETSVASATGSRLT